MGALLAKGLECISVFVISDIIFSNTKLLFSSHSQSYVCILRQRFMGRQATEMVSELVFSVCETRGALVMKCASHRRRLIQDDAEDSGLIT